MIPADIIQKIKRVHIKSRRTVNNLMAGQYRSVFKGSGIEFEEVREYCPGDEVKSIDWKVSARFGKPFIKRYREERESILMLLIDMSASLKFGTFSGQKLETVAEVASVLAFNAIKNNDKVGVIFFSDQVEKYIPPKKGSAHIWRVIKEIFTFVPNGKKTDIGSALAFYSRISKKRSFVFILSDFLGEGYEKQLKIVRQKHEPVGIRIYDEGSFQLPLKGIVRLLDFETGTHLLFDAWSRRTRKGFLQAKRREFQQTQEIFSKAKTDLVNLKTSDSISDTLTQYFRLRERRFR